jgi:branched-chain amino acid transport system substrate-binding protein
VTAAKPDAIVIIAFDETKSIVPELANAGWDMSKTYFVDGNLADYSADFEPGHPCRRAGHPARPGP